MVIEYSVSVKLEICGINCDEIAYFTSYKCFLSSCIDLNILAADSLADFGL